MENEELLKRIEFLAIVQTTMIANGVNLSSQTQLQEQYRHDYSGIGVKNLMCDAVLASRSIPEGKSSVDAAEEFLVYFLFSDQSKSEEGNFPSWIRPGFGE